MRLAILHVEDEPSVRNAVRRALQAYGFAVASVDGVSAAKLSLGERGDIVGALLDLRLGDGNGIDFYRWLLEHRPAIARCVAFMTATPDDGAFVGLKGTGCRVFDKPVDVTELVALVAEWEGAAADPARVGVSASSERVRQHEPSYPGARAQSHDGRSPSSPA